MDEHICPHCGTAMQLYGSLKLVTDVQDRFRCTGVSCGICGGRCLERATTLRPAA
jgi:heterodisulfide reductase subunit A-like polyferredoxin